MYRVGGDCMCTIIPRYPFSLPFSFQCICHFTPDLTKVNLTMTRLHGPSAGATVFCFFFPAPNWTTQKLSPSDSYFFDHTASSAPVIIVVPEKCYWEWDICIWRHKLSQDNSTQMPQELTPNHFPSCLPSPTFVDSFSSSFLHPIPLWNILCPPPYFTTSPWPLYLSLSCSSHLKLGGQENTNIWGKGGILFCIKLCGSLDQGC